MLEGRFLRCYRPGFVSGLLHGPSMHLSDFSSKITELVIGGREVFTISDLVAITGMTRSKDLSSLISRAIRSGIITKSCHGIYVAVDEKIAHLSKEDVLEKIAAALRRFDRNYVSQESALFHYGLIAREPGSLLVRTTGRSGVCETSHGRILFINTRMSGDDIQRETVPGRVLPMARVDRAVIDFRMCGGTFRSDMLTRIKTMIDQLPEKPKRTRAVVTGEVLHAEIFSALIQSGLIFDLTLSKTTAMRYGYAWPGTIREIEFATDLPLDLQLCNSIISTLSKRMLGKYGERAEVSLEYCNRNSRQSGCDLCNQIRINVSCRDYIVPSLIETATIVIERKPCKVWEIGKLRELTDILPQGVGDSLVRIQRMQDILADKIIDLARFGRSGHPLSYRLMCEVHWLTCVSQDEIPLSDIAERAGLAGSRIFRNSCGQVIDLTEGFSPDRFMAATKGHIPDDIRDVYNSIDAGRYLTRRMNRIISGVENFVQARCAEAARDRSPVLA